MPHIRSRKHAAERLARPLGLTALATLVVPGAVHAQQTLPTVNVRGSQQLEYRSETSSNPKVARPLSETPQTLTVIRKEVLQDQQAMTLSEALRNTPGITMLMGENGNTTTGDGIYMRGMDTQGSIFVDGMRDIGTYARDLYNIEQVEVVKGPAGADIGRGSPTGYVNLITKLPLLENSGSASLGVGSGVFARATVDLNQRLGGQNSGTAFRLNAMKQGGDVAGRDEVTNGGWGIAPSLSFGLGTPTRVHLQAQHLERDRRPDGGLSTIGLPGYYAETLARAGIRPGTVDTDNYYGARSDNDFVKVDQFTARIEHDLRPGLTVRNNTRYGVSHQTLRLTAVGNASFATPSDPASYTVALSRHGKIQRNEILTNQTSVSADFRTGALRHTLVGGIEFIYEKQNSTTLTGQGTQLPQNLYNPSLDLTFQPIAPNGARTRGDTTTIAGYVSDTIDVTDRVQIGAGLRLDRYRTEFTGVPAATAADQSTTMLSKSDLLKTWKLSTLYKLTDTGNVYAAYGHSEKPPGSDNFTLNSATPNANTGLIAINNPNLDPQTARNIELGTKWDLMNRKLALSAALFRTTLKNDLATRDEVTQTVTQFGERRVQGIELGAIGTLADNWQIMAGVARMNTEVEAGTNATQGAMVNWSPKLTLTAWTTYHLPRTGLTVGAGARHVSMQRRQVSNVPNATVNMPEIDGYTVFDAMALYEINRNFSLQLNLFNVTDKFYVQSMNNAGNRYTLGTPRSVMLSGILRV